MFVYIDETFNLTKGRKNQFMAIAGFAVMNPSESAKAYKRLKKKGLPKSAVAKEIKSTNAFSELYILPKLLSKEHKIPNIEVGIVLQYKATLKHHYFEKEKLNYDRLYLDLVKLLLTKAWKYIDKDIVIVTLDTFATKRINKEDIAGAIQAELKLQNPGVNFNVRFGTSEIENLQIADQLCGIVHKHLAGNKDYLICLKNLYDVKELIDPFSA